MKLHQDISDALLTCQQPFNALPKFPTDAEQDLCLNFNFAVFHCGERVLADSYFRLTPVPCQ